MSFVVTFSNTADVFALGFGEPPEISNRQKAHLNIAYTGGGGNGSTPSTCTTSTTLPGNDNPEKAFLYFVQQGFTEKQAAGIIGNFMVESGVNPLRVQGAGIIESQTLPSSGGYGIAQWDDRKLLLKKFATTVDPQKRPIYDLGLQLDFVMYELKGPKEQGGSTEASAYAAFMGVKDNIKQATTVWMERYERPGKPALSERIAAANKAYGDYSTGAGNPSTPPLAPTETATCGGSGDIVAIAQAELAKGVIEKPIGCDAGNPSAPGDCGAEVNKYTDNTLEYWCADFVSWVYKTSGAPFSGGSSGGWRLASVESVEAYMRKNGTFTNNTPTAPNPQPGDVYVINNGEHIGIVVKVEGNKLYTISGNTSTDNYSNGVGVGDTVYSDFKKNKSITGYGGLR